MSKPKLPDASAPLAETQHFPTESVASMGARIKQVREALSLEQKPFAAAIGMPLPSLKGYEGDKSIPGGEAIIQLCSPGVNANWLLTGEGEMWLKDLVRPPPALNQPLLSSVLAEVQAALARLRLQPSPEKHAKVVALIYEHSLPTGELQAGVVERFLELIS